MAKTRRLGSRKNRAIVAVVVIVVLAVAALFAYRAVSGDAAATVTYTTATAKKMNLTSSIDGTGNIELPNIAAINPTVSGTVAGLELKVGDSVKKGQTLFTAVNPQLDVAVSEAQNAYDKALLAVDSAGLELASAKTSLADLYDSGQTGLQMKQSKVTVASAELAVTAAHNAVTSAEIVLAEAMDDANARMVTAPLAGIVTAVSVANGDTVGGTGAEAAIILTDPGVYQAVVTLAESDISAIEVGQQALLTFDALPDLTLFGQVTRVDTTGTNESGVVSYSVIITPETMDESVKGGMTVSVSIITATANGVLAVPSSAVKSSPNGKYVQVLQNGQPTNVMVEVGMSNESYTEITSGLSEGQEIITATKTSGGDSVTSTTTRRSVGGFDEGGFIFDGNGPAGGPPAGGGAMPTPSGQ